MDAFYHKCMKGSEGNSLPAPTLTFGFILATIFGAAFHLVFGGDVRRLATFLLVGWVGFFFGHLLGVNLGISVFNVGSLRIVGATVGAFSVLFLAHFMTKSKRSVR